jgi:hygromycin-B 7''-O-kinase
VVVQICGETAVSPATHIIAGFPGSCAVFVVDEQVVVKLYPPMLAQDFYREREVYGLLNGRLPHLPRLLGNGLYPDQIDWPYLLLEFCEGIAIRDVFDEIMPDNRLTIARELGEMLRVVHKTAVTNVTTLDPSPTAWSEFITNRRANSIAELRQETYLTETVLAELKALLAGMDLRVQRPLLVNADLTEDHLLLVKRADNWHISALIDWADAELAAVEYEWIALWFGLCRRDGAMFREILRAYNPHLEVDDNFLQRVMAYTCLHRFGMKIVDDVLGQNGRPPIHSLARLRTQLWDSLERF